MKGYKSTLKVIEVEEWYDLVFSRPVGYVIALGASWCRLTPTHVSVLSMVSGVAAGYCFAFQDHLTTVLWGSLLLTIAGLLDSADGILARLTNQSTRLGYIIDGIVDNVVYLSAYVGGIVYLITTGWGWWVVGLALLSGMSHSIRALIYVLYKDDCMYFFGDRESAYRPCMDEVNQDKKTGIVDRTTHFFYRDQTQKQWWFGTRSPEYYKSLQHLKAAKGDAFKRQYKSDFIPMLSAWALVGGGNVHRLLIIGTSVLGLFQWFFYISILLNIPTLVIWWIQRMKDNRFINALNCDSQNDPVTVS